jgi:hypothetical protein
MATGAQRSRQPKQLAAGAFQQTIDSFRLYLAAEGKSGKTIRTYVEAAQWFAAAHLLARTGHADWDQVEVQDIQRWMAWLLDNYSDSYASNQYRALQQFFRCGRLRRWSAATGQARAVPGRAGRMTASWKPATGCVMSGQAAERSGESRHQPWQPSRSGHLAAQPGARQGLRQAGVPAGVIPGRKRENAQPCPVQAAGAFPNGSRLPEGEKPPGRRIEDRPDTRPEGAP